MGRLIELISEREIQILVLLSFTLQLFLFFGGRLRRGNSNRFLRLCLWAAYLGADLAAVYALGYLSRRQDVSIDRNLLTGTQPLGFFWAPFLLIHLGGQDTITAFAMEDNNLWKRHLLNLVTQVVLALYVFWKSIGKHSANLLLAGSFVFVAGIIKYGERIWSLKSGSLQSIESSDKYRYDTKWPDNSRRVDGSLQDALDSMADVLAFFSDRSLINFKHIKKLRLRGIIRDPDEMIWKVSLQLGMIYDDVYTKSFVLRSWTGAILRCISQAAVIVAFVVFLVSDKVTYGKADIAISYSLFVGCLFLEVCSIAVSMMSPWTWAWFKGKECEGLASLFMFVLRRDIGYPMTMKQRWPNIIGQYNLYSWLCYREQQRRKYSQGIMILFTRLFVGLFRVRMEKPLWMSKVLDIEYMDMDSMILKRVVEEIHHVIHAGDVDEEPFLWQNNAQLFKSLVKAFDIDFGFTTVRLHLITERYLEELDSSDAYMEAKRSDVTLGLMEEVCRKLSLYMMYLLVTQPSMLPLSVSAGATLDFVNIQYSAGDAESYLDPGNQKSVEELARMWMRLLIYAAGKSRAALHVPQLGRGGELITFIWLVMAHSRTGECQENRIQLFKSDARIESQHKVQYAFALPSDEEFRHHHR